MNSNINITSKMLKKRNFSSSRMIFEISFGWLQVLLLITLFIYDPNWWVFLVIFILMGSRQYSLLILLHDAQHTLLNKNRKVNDIIATLFLAAPFGVIFSKSRLNHMQHHQNLGHGNTDPDFPLYCIGQPSPKSSTLLLITHFLNQLIWGKLVRVFLWKGTKFIKKTPSISIPKSTLSFEILSIVAWQFTIFSFFIYFGMGFAYFYIWLLPLLMVATLLNDARIFCEHSNPQDERKNNPLLISYISSPVERFFFSPHHMNYHAEHHLFPFLPHYNLPMVRNHIKDLPEYKNQIQWRQGYCHHLLNFIKSLKKSGRKLLTSK